MSLFGNLHDRYSKRCEYRLQSFYSHVSKRFDVFRFDPFDNFLSEYTSVIEIERVYYEIDRSDRSAEESSGLKNAIIIKQV